SNIEEREEGGTPEILGAIRLGLVFQLKERLGSLEVSPVSGRGLCFVDQHACHVFSSVLLVKWTLR
ncbi:unnamed protein product, partial [Sphacelaria rigidula]